MSVKKLSKSDRQSLLTIQPQIDNRLGEFLSLPNSKWLREIGLCLLTPQSSPVSAENAIAKLEEEGFFEGRLSESEISTILRSPPNGGYVRFHLTKAKRLVRFVEIKSKVEQIVFSQLKAIDEREQLHSLINGFGLKEASHALRNIGRKNLAILDRHILRCLAEYQVISDPKVSLTTKNYLEIEAKFIKFATANHLTIDQLDLFFWWKATGFIFK